MLIRHVSLVACLCWASLATYGDATGAGYIFELPGPSIAGSHFQGFGYNANPFNPLFDNNGPTSAYKIVPMPDGSKFYMLGAGGGGLQSFDPTFSTPKSINGILAGTACTIALTPDGKYLLIASALTCPSATNGGTTSSLYVLDTSNDTILPNSVTLTGVVQAFTISQDSKTAWILGNTTFGNLSSVIAMNLNNRTEIGTQYNLPFGGATSLTLSPLGLLYVTLGNRIYEIDPATLTVTSNGEIPINALGPGPLRFTPDGTTAYLVNSSPTLGGVSLLKVNLATKSVATWPVFNSGITPPVFDDVYPVSNTEVFAFSSLNTTLWDVTPATLSVAPSTLFGGTFPTSNVLNVAFSSELPAARYFYVLVGNGNQTSLYRMNLSNNQLDLQTLALLGPGVLQFVAVPPQTGTAAFLQYAPSTNQIVKPSGTSTPLTVIAVDGSGRPVYNVPITYATDPTTGVVINGAAQTTNSNGWATTTATLPAAPGNYVVTVTSGSATASFTLTVPGANGGGTTGPGGTSQVSIVSGDGQFLQYNQPSRSPLVVEVVDTNGNPLSGQSVTFSIVNGPGNVDTAGFTVTTDVNGQASTDFFAGNPQQGVPYQSTDVNASTSLGGVDFTETTFILNPDGTGQPQVAQVSPPLDTPFIIAGEGDVLPNAITASISTSQAITGQSLPVPGVGIRIASGNDVTLPAPAYCQGSTLSDNNGIAHCNLVATCQAGVTLPYVFGIQAVVGEYHVLNLPNIKLVPGSSRAINILAGNNQTGRGGQVLPIDLTATVTDNCSSTIPAVVVTWAVTQGSATLSNVKSTSDAGGHISARVTLGSTPGPVQITVSIPGAQQVFNITNQVVVNSLTLISGDQQTGFINNTVPQPLVFQVKDINGNPVVNAQVTFTVTGNGAVNPTTGTTDASGKVSTVINAGSTPSTVVVTANYAGFTATASATIKLPGPVISANSFQNAASFQSGLVPCGLATVAGPGLAPNVQGVVLGNPLNIGPLPYTLATVTITVNGVPAPLYYVANLNGTQQVSFQTPCETLPNSSATVVISVNGTPTTTSGVAVLTAQPGIFTYAGPNSILYGVVVSTTDGSYVTPSNPAKRGGTYFMVATGLGQTQPAILSNAAGVTGQNLLAQTVVGVDNYGVPVISTQYVQGSIGEYVITFTIPTTLTINGTTTPFPTGTNMPLSLGVVIGGQTIFSAPAAIPAVQ